MSITVGDNYGGTSSCSADGWEVETFGRTLAREGYVVVAQSSHLRPANHRLIGTGVGHDDARWAETRWTEGSMASYYENDDARGPWWARDRDGFQTTGVRYYGARPVFGRYGERAQLHARHSYLIERGAGHDGCGWCSLIERESLEAVPA